MYTVQWWLNHVDESELTNTFFTIYPVDFERTADLSKSIHQAQSFEKLRFLSFLYNLRAVDVRSESEDHVFFAVPKYEGGEDVIMTCLCRTGDLCESESPETLTWLLVDFDELLGYWIADTELTRNNILCVLSKILYVASFLGYSGKYRELYQSIQLEEGQEADSPCEPGGPVDMDAEALKQDIWQAEMTYNEYCFQREARALRALLTAS